MGQVAVFDNKKNVARRGYDMFVVDADGEISIGRVHAVSARKEMATRDELTEIHDDIEQVVATAPGKETITFECSSRELNHAVIWNKIHGDGAAPTINNYQQLVREVKRGNFLLGTDKHRLSDVAGIPQTYDTTDLFKAPGAPTATPGTGTIAAATYKVFVVPISVDMDRAHGAAAVTLAKFADGTLVHGVDWIKHDASPSDECILAAPGGIAVTWSNTTGSLRPTHYLITAGTVDDVNDASQKVCAVVAYGTTSATFSALGTLTFGADAVIADLHQYQTIASGDPLTYTTRTDTTDYVFDKAAGTFVRVAGGAINSGESGRLIVWRIKTYNFTQKLGGSGVTEHYCWLRIKNSRADDDTPATRRRIAQQIDFPRVNLAGLAGDLLTGNDDGFHTPKRLGAFTAEYDAAKGCIAYFDGEMQDYRYVVDYFSSSISPANV